MIADKYAERSPAGFPLIADKYAGRSLAGFPLES